MCRDRRARGSHTHPRSLQPVPWGVTWGPGEFLWQNAFQELAVGIRDEQTGGASEGWGWWEAAQCFSEWDGTVTTSFPTAWYIPWKTRGFSAASLGNVCRSGQAAGEEGAQVAGKRFLRACWHGSGRGESCWGLAEDGERSHSWGGAEGEPNLHSPLMGDCSIHPFFLRARRGRFQAPLSKSRLLDLPDDL